MSEIKTTFFYNILDKIYLYYLFLQQITDIKNVLFVPDWYLAVNKDRVICDKLYE